MKSLQFIRAAVYAALAVACLAGTIRINAQSVSGQEIDSVTQSKTDNQNLQHNKQPEKPEAQLATSGATAKDRQVYRPGLRNSFMDYPLNASELELVTAQLRHKTGFMTLRFDKAGFLTIDDRSQIIGGSQAARELLVAAIDGTQSILLQSHNRSPKVVFGRATQGTLYTDAQPNLKIETELIEIDFIDFKKLRGHHKAIEALDLGFVILHELCHTVLKLHDPGEKAEATGDCETYVNRIRRELRIPERLQYAATASLKQIFQSTPTATVAKLMFAQTRPGSEPGERTKTKKFLAWWVSQEVGTASIFSSRR